MKYKNTLIIGTSHIAKESISKLVDEFKKFEPDIVCVELDLKRLHALTNNDKPDYSLKGIKKYGFQGYLFALIGGFIQRKLGNIVGVKPGSDMLTAVNLAKQNKKQLFLIDQDIEVTLKKFSKKFSWKEKMRLIIDLLRAPFSKKTSIDLNKVPEKKLIEMVLKQTRERYPNLYYVLIEERNQIMAKNIQRIMEKNPDKKILVVVGAGHENDLVGLIKKQENKRDKIY